MSNCNRTEGHCEYSKQVERDQSDSVEYLFLNARPCSESVASEDEKSAGFTEGSNKSHPSLKCDNDVYSLTIETLPVEMLMYIFQYLDAKFIQTVLCKVCTLFKELFESDIYWKTRITKRWKKHYPPIYDKDFDWETACVEREECHRVWNDYKNTCHYVKYCEGVYAPVDAVHLMQKGRLLASGSRDRYLNLVDLTKYDPHEKESLKRMKIYSDDKDHKGWIWAIQSHRDTMYTASWDTYIKMWDMNSGTLREINKFKCKSAVLALHAEENWIVGAGYNQFLYMIDPRDGTGSKKKFHRRPVLSVVANDHYVISGSEDKTMAVYDRRAARVYKTIQLEEFPMTLSLVSNQLWVGDKKGLIHLYDATYGGYEHIQEYDVGHTGKLTGVQYTHGALFTCSTDNTVKVLEPSRDPSIITTLHEHNGEVARLSYLGGILATAGSDSCIGLWIPKNKLINHE